MFQFVNEIRDRGNKLYKWKRKEIFVKVVVLGYKFIERLKLK